MALAVRTAVLLWGRDSASKYREALRRLPDRVDGLTIFSDLPRQEAGELHYLRFAELDGANPFDLVVHNLDDAPEFTSSFPYVVRRPGVLFLGDVYLHRYARAAGHSALDSWGYRWIVGAACPERADALARLAEAGIPPGALARKLPLAPALARRSAAVVVPDYRSWQLLDAEKNMPSVSVITPPGTSVLDGQGSSSTEFEAFADAVERMLPSWIESAKDAAAAIPPLEHPHRDLLALEHRLVLERFDEEDRAMAELAAQPLDEMLGRP